MKFANRKILPKELLSKGFKFFLLFPRLRSVKHPWSVLKYYIQESSPDFVELKGKTKILFSSHPHDVITFFVVFLKQEYGKIKEDSIVVDVGANIGVFSLYAALSGAKKVYAFEPSKEAFEILCKNIELNNFTDVIIPVNKAVSNIDDLIIQFPCSSSPYNSIGSCGSNNDLVYSEIQTVTIDSFIDRNGDINRIDLLKLDCEGAEFDILPSISEVAFEKISAIRMECHGEPRELIELLNRKDYMVDLNKENIIWLTRCKTDR